MLTGRNKLLRLLTAITVMSVAVSAYYVWYSRRHFHSDKFVTQEVGAPPINWRTLRVRWTQELTQNRSPLHVNDLVVSDGRIFFSAGSQICEINPVSGSVKWKQNLKSQGIQDDMDWSWKLLFRANRLIAIQDFNCVGSADSYKTTRVCCMNARDGEPIWEVGVEGAMLDQPVLASSAIVLPLHNGEICGLDFATGNRNWRRQIVQVAKDKNSAEISIRAAGDVCIVRSDGRHFIRLDPLTGNTLWTFPRGKQAKAGDDQRADAPFWLDRDGLFIVGPDSQFVCVESRSGLPRWRRAFSTFADDLHLVTLEGAAVDPSPVPGGLIAARFQGVVIALRKSDGHLAWKHPRSEDAVRSNSLQEWQAAISGSDQPLVGDLFVKDTTYPVSIRRHVPLYSLDVCDNLVVEDAATGAEKYRYQLASMNRDSRVIPLNGHFVCQDDCRVCTLEEGPEFDIPVSPAGKHQLAYDTIKLSSGWSPINDSLFGRLRNKLPFLANRYQDNYLSQIRRRPIDDLTLIELGEPAVPPLLELIQHQLNPDDSGRIILSFPGRSRRSEVMHTLDLLADMNNRKALQGIIGALKREKREEESRYLAETLIRMNSPQAMRTLLTYAEAQKNDDSSGGEEVMAYLCHFAPSTTNGGKGLIDQAEIAGFLRRALHDTASPTWLRKFAGFELRRRSSEPFDLHITPEVQRCPSVIPTDVRALSADSKPVFSACRIADGNWWGVTLSDYFGGRDLWIARSIDGVHWTNPTLASPGFGWYKSMSLSQISGSNGRRLKLACKDDDNHVDISTLDLDAIYRDSDGDGIPDIAERRLGSNPHLRDSRGTGIIDGVNKNLTYRPHALDRDELIYQAVIEGVCRYLFVHTGSPIAQSYSQLRTDLPMIFPAGPTSSGVPIYGFPNLLLKDVGVNYPYWSGLNGIQLCNPAIRLDGRQSKAFTYLERSSISYNEDQDPQAIRNRIRACLSKDGRTARLGVTLQRPLTRYDVEVQERRGIWRAVECWTTSRYEWQAAAPPSEFTLPQ